MEKEELLARVDHTLLNPEATWDQVKQICDEAVRFHTASVCINPCYVRQAVEYLAGRVPVCTVIGFPLGATSTQAKLAEAQQALMDGCSEFDMVINIGRLKMGDVDFVRSEIAALKQLVGKHILKVIVETCLLTDVEKAMWCAKQERITSKLPPDFPRAEQHLRTLPCLPKRFVGAAKSKRLVGFVPEKTWNGLFSLGQIGWELLVASGFYVMAVVKMLQKI